jgi:uncharacterized membrane protein
MKGNNEKKYKILFGLAIVLALTSWIIAASYWGRLPAVIPTHFGFSGQANTWADKSIFYVFLIPFLQSFLLGWFIFLNYYPQYSSVPTTLWLVTLDKKHKKHAFELIRTMLAGVSIWIGLLFTYITYGMNEAAMNDSKVLSPWVIVALVGLMLLWLVYWTIKVIKATKDAIASANKK